MSQATTDEIPADEMGILRTQLDLLEAENHRLRDEITRARQMRYRRTAIGFAAIGTLAIVAGIAMAPIREVAIAFGAIGIFGAILVHYLTPDAVISADVGERVYSAMATNAAAIADDLGLRDEAIYVTDETDSILIVPQDDLDVLPDLEDGPFVTDPAVRSLVLTPTGSHLFNALSSTTRSLDEGMPPSVVVDMLADAVVEQFELATRVEADIEDGRATFAITGSTFGDLDRFDHPVASFLAVGLSRAIERPVDMSVDRAEGRSDWYVTCRWDSSTAPDSS